MRPYLQLPYAKTSVINNLLGYFFLLSFTLALSHSASFAKALDESDTCLWSFEQNAHSSNSPSSIEKMSLSMMLMDIIPADTTICAGQSIQFSVDGVDPSFTYEWSATDGFFDDINSPTPIYNIFSAGTYSVIVIIFNIKIYLLNIKITKKIKIKYLSLD